MADAFIVIGKRPDHYKKMYDVLNELILFGGSGCSNERKLEMALIKDKKEPIVLDLDIFIHLMTSAYREGFKAGAGKNIQRLENDCASAVSQFRFGMADMLNEPESTVQH